MTPSFEDARGRSRSPGSSADATTVDLDLALVQGFRFACRPDCGLCCYASPGVRADEEPGLRTAAPVALISEGPGDWRLRQQGPGGACALLAANRCRAHTVRPFPCRTFPLHVYLGARPQVSVVLSCPGLDLERWSAEPADRPPIPPTDAFPSEREALRRRWRSPGASAGWDRARRTRSQLLERFERRPGFEDLETLRERFRTEVPLPRSPEEGEALEVAEADGLDLLPLYWDGPEGPVALSASPGGLELLRLRPTGGVRERLGTYSEQFAPERISEAAKARLRRYGRYLLDRDHFLDSAALEWRERRYSEPLSDTLGRCLAEALATVLTRGAARARSAGRPVDPIGPETVLEGIRATDADLLDRPALGAVL